MSEMVFCRGCAKEIHITARACPGCGAPQAGTGNGKSKIAAGLLAILLGGLGVHRFYLGKWWGVFYLLFCWTGLPALISLIEGIVFLCTSDQNWDAKYNKGVPSNNSGAAVVIAIVVSLFGLVFIVGILAAIAIPAYQDYTIKAKVANAMGSANQVAMSVGNYIVDNKAIPANITDAGFSGTLPAAISEITVDQQNATLTVSVRTNAYDEKTFMLVPAQDEQKNLTWRCKPGSMQAKYLPRNCRDSGN
ncbi:NINE protein [Undibacterium terreum]|uniref:TM2 domain-containing protein n=1 Tax=Undibacterium terreum TaxID=1224302 RepID=A0A916UN30_9BURK|nr:NINE protein [Undibacterium terreum]GGC79677.1 hypothetical protein GCM10011396_28710 [Undibacterium terreum]